MFAASTIPRLLSIHAAALVPSSHWALNKITNSPLVTYLFIVKRWTFMRLMYTRRRRKKPNRKMRKIKFIFFTFYPLMYVHRCESFLTFTLHAGFSFLEFIFILYHANTEGKEMCMQNAACSPKLFPTNFHFSALKYRCLVCDTPRRRCKNFFPGVLATWNLFPYP